MTPSVGHGLRRHVRSDADVERHLAAGEEADDGVVLHRADPVGNPGRLQRLDGLRHPVGAAPFPRVDQWRQGEGADPVEDPPEFPRRNGGLVASEAESGNAGPRGGLVKIEDPAGSLGPPLPHRIEEDDDPPRPGRLVLPESRLEGTLDFEPRKADPLDHRRRYIDLGVRDPFPSQPPREVAADIGIVGGRLQTTANVTVELEEGPGTVETSSPADLFHRREGRVTEPRREPDQRSRRDRPLEVKVELPFPGRAKRLEEREGAGRQWPHVAGSYASSRSPVERIAAARKREGFWKRGAALGVDLLLLGGVPLLLSTVVVFSILLAFPTPSPLLPWVFRGAQAIFLITFLLRDSLDVSPGKHLFGLRVIRLAGGKVTPLDSFVRNLPLVLPPWNFIECLPAWRSPDGRRAGDRLAGTAVVEE